MPLILTFNYINTFEKNVIWLVQILHIKSSGWVCICQHFSSLPYWEMWNDFTHPKTVVHLPIPPAGIPHCFAGSGLACLFTCVLSSAWGHYSWRSPPCLNAGAVLCLVILSLVEIAKLSCSSMLISQDLYCSVASGWGWTLHCPIGRGAHTGPSEF